MKYSKLYKCLLAIALLSLLPAQEADAQLLRRIFGKAAAKTVTKKAKKEVVEKTTKELAEEMAEKSAKEWTRKSVAKRSARRVARSSSEAALRVFREEGAEKVMKAEVGRISREVIEETAQKGLKVSVVHRGASLAGKEYAHMARREVVEESERLVARKMQAASVERLQRNELSRLAVKEGVEAVVEDRVESLLGKTAARVWKDVVGEAGEAATRQLLEDVGENRAVRKIFQRNPELLKAYYRMGNSACRTDITMLRYMDYGAGKYGRAFPKLGKAWGLEDNLFIRSESGANRIYNKAGEYLGTISGDARTGFLIECSAKNRTLLNVYPLGNASYVCEGNLWKTDQLGRVIYARTTRTGRVANVVGRNAQLQKDVLTLKNSTTAAGNAVSSAQRHINDEAGHLIALSHGGTNDFINFVPQHNRINRNAGAYAAEERAWFLSEHSMTNALKNGDSVEREVFLNYKGNNTLRPDSFEITQRVNGRIDAVPVDRSGNRILMDRLKIINPD